ncbi:MAG TPA: DUF305 domain-containing protein [Actinomycetota bacterium]|nr:DUF305 domain-containing protein [Actinomycetota bacterium]
MRIQHVKRNIVIAAVAAAALVAGGCSSDDDSDGTSGMDMGSDSSESTTTSAETSEIPSDAEFNQADVDFAQGMIPHHAQAIEMADMAIAQSDSAEVTDLAERIRAAQDPEIEQLTTWLEDWGQDVPDREMSMDHDMGDMSMDGMMTQDQMGEMAAATGAEFDRMFLEMMIVHHEGAVSMAEDEVANGKYEPAIEMAQSIIDGQSAEIDEMNQLLQS